MLELPLRQETEQKYHWHLEDIFPSNDIWEQTFTDLEAKLPSLAAIKGTLGQSAFTLKNSLETIDQASESLGKLYWYARMRADEDATDSESQARSNRAQALLVKYFTAIAFLEPELLTIPEETIKEFTSQKPELHTYQHYFDNLWRQKEHILNTNEEFIMAKAGQLVEAPHAIYNMLNHADLKFPEVTDDKGNKVQLTHGRFIPLMQSQDRKVRLETFTSFYSTYDQVKHSTTALLSAQVNANIFNAEVRKYRSAREAALAKNNISLAVYDSLIEAVNAKLPAMHQYVALRKKMLNLKELHMYDVYVPIVEETKTIYSFEDSKKIVKEALKPLGAEYLNILDQGMESGWCDVYENKGKRSGAYSCGVYGVHPYVLLNHQDTLDSLFTLAHEMGHAMHSYYTNKYQPFIYSDYSIFVAEVASTVNESLLMNYLLQKALNKKEKMFLLNHYLEEFKGTVFRQTMFAEFEKMIHEEVENGSALTVDYLNSVYKALNEKYFGPEMIVGDLISLEWSRIPHFYLNFYVYQYATGFSSAVALAMGILENGREGLNRYLDFLKAGSSKYPIDILTQAGVNISTPDPIVKALNVFEQIVAELSALALDN